MRTVNGGFQDFALKFQPTSTLELSMLTFYFTSSVKQNNRNFYSNSR